jgi:phage terminase large subunit-like protein
MVGEADRRGNLYPNKSRPDLRIDVAVALIMAMGRAMVGDKQAKGLNGLPLNGQRRSVVK